MIDPRLMSVMQWTDAVNLTLSTRASPTKLLTPAEWQQWAYNLISIPSVAAYSPPNPKSYTDWRTWAERFVECVPL